MNATKVINQLIRAQIAILRSPTTAPDDYAAKVMIDTLISRVAGR